MDNQLSRQETGMTRVKNYMLSPEVKERFSEMMGPNGIYYLNQVLIVVANSTELQKCDPRSILIAAMRAASLQLSVDPGQGQAWIIPYKGTATFQIGYHGVYELAMRTNLYRFINVIDIHEGEELIENRMTGNHTIGGKRTGDKVIAYMLYFQLINGFEKTFPMTLEEIDAHARRYSQAYNSGRSKWNDPFERRKMEKKTVLMNGLRKWGRFNPGDADTLNQIESEQGWVSVNEFPEEGDVTEPEKEAPRSEAEILSDLGFDQPSIVEAAQELGGEVVSSAAWTNEKVTIETAMTEQSSDGTKYWDMPSDKLAVRVNSINASLKKNHLDEDAKAERELKRDVIQAILQHRQGA